jgi:hypothetical protein
VSHAGAGTSCTTPARSYHASHTAARGWCDCTSGTLMWQVYGATCASIHLLAMRVLPRSACTQLMGLPSDHCSGRHHGITWQLQGPRSQGVTDLSTMQSEALRTKQAGPSRSPQRAVKISAQPSQDLSTGQSRPQHNQVNVSAQGSQDLSTAKPTCQHTAKSTSRHRSVNISTQRDKDPGSSKPSEL